MGYLITDTATIQGYLDLIGTIQIADPPDGTFAESLAETLENEAFDDISDWLSIAWETVGTSSRLARQTAKLTAAKIASIRIGSALATPPEWANRWKNEVRARCMFWVLNHKTTTFGGETKQPSVPPLKDLLILTKTREQNTVEGV